MFYERFAIIPNNLWRHYFLMFSFLFIYVRIFFFVIWTLEKTLMERSIWSFCKRYALCENNIQLKCFRKTFHERCINVFVLTCWECYQRQDKKKFSYKITQPERSKTSECFLFAFFFAHKKIIVFLGRYILWQGYLKD